MAIDRATFSQEVEDLSSAVADLVDRLDTGELESLAVLPIKEHRRRRRMLMKNGTLRTQASKTRVN
jgi:hypothetical protein